VTEFSSHFARKMPSWVYLASAFIQIRQCT